VPPVTGSTWLMTSAGGDGRHRGCGRARPTLPASIQEVDEMLNADVARYRTDDLLRAGAARRAGRAVVDRERAGRAARLRRVVTTAIAMFPIPVKH